MPAINGKPVEELWTTHSEAAMILIGMAIASIARGRISDRLVSPLLRHGLPGEILHFS